MACRQPPHPEDLTTETVFISYLHFSLQNDVMEGEGSYGIMTAMDYMESRWMAEIVNGLELAQYHQAIDQLGKELTLDPAYHDNKEMVHSDFPAYLSKISSDVFPKGIHWKRIVQTISNSLKMVKDLSNVDQIDRVKNIIQWYIDLISQVASGKRESLNEWIAEQGGWGDLQTILSIKDNTQAKEDTEKHGFQAISLQEQQQQHQEHPQAPRQRQQIDQQKVFAKKAVMASNQCKCNAYNVDRLSDEIWDRCPRCKRHRCLVGQCQYQPMQYYQLVRHMKAIHPEQLPLPTSTFRIKAAISDLDPNQCVCGELKNRSGNEPWQRCACEQYWCLMSNCTYQTLVKGSLLQHISGVHEEDQTLSPKEHHDLPQKQQGRQLQIPRRTTRRDLPLNRCQCGVSIDRNTDNTWDRCSQCRRFRCLTEECPFQAVRFARLREHKMGLHSDEPALPSSLPPMSRLKNLETDLLPNKCVCGTSKDRLPNKAWDRCKICGQFWCLAAECEFMSLTSASLGVHLKFTHKQALD